VSAGMLALSAKLPTSIHVAFSFWKSTGLRFSYFPPTSVASYLKLLHNLFFFPHLSSSSSVLLALIWTVCGLNNYLLVY